MTPEFRHERRATPSHRPLLRTALFALAFGVVPLLSPPETFAQAGRSCSPLSPCPSGFSCQPIFQKCYHSPRRLGEPCSAGFSCGAGLRCAPILQECVDDGVDRRLRGDDTNMGEGDASTTASPRVLGTIDGRGTVRGRLTGEQRYNGKPIQYWQVTCPTSGALYIDLQSDFDNYVFLFVGELPPAPGSRLLSSNDDGWDGTNAALDQGCVPGGPIYWVGVSAFNESGSWGEYTLRVNTADNVPAAVAPPPPPPPPPPAPPAATAFSRLVDPFANTFALVNMTRDVRILQPNIGGVAEAIPLERARSERVELRLVPGLAGTGYSFQLVRYPDHYLRHMNFRVVTMPFDGSRQFREDATFNAVAPIGSARGAAYSFEAVNFPEHYIAEFDGVYELQRRAEMSSAEHAVFYTTNPR